MSDGPVVMEPQRAELVAAGEGRQQPHFDEGLTKY